MRNILYFLLGIVLVLTCTGLSAQKISYSDPWSERRIQSADRFRKNGGCRFLDFGNDR